MRPEVAKRLLDALQGVRRIQEFTFGLDFEAFEANALTRSAVERQFEIVGEALGRAGGMDPQIETILPELPRIVGLRNRIIHGYDSVDHEIVWDIIQTKAASLQTRLEHCLNENGFPTTS